MIYLNLYKSVNHWKSADKRILTITYNLRTLQGSNFKTLPNTNNLEDELIYKRGFRYIYRKFWFNCRIMIQLIKYRRVFADIPYLITRSKNYIDDPIYLFNTILNNIESNISIHTMPFFFDYNSDIYLNYDSMNSIVSNIKAYVQLHRKFIHKIIRKFLN